MYQIDFIHKQGLKFNLSKIKIRNYTKQKMNFYTVELDNFIVKIKNLLKKLIKSSSSQIQQHLSTCHSLVSRLINDESTLNSLSSSKMRLLVYQLMLFIAQKFNQKELSFQELQKAFSKNKILCYLSQIQNTLSSIKELINTNQKQEKGININFVNSKKGSKQIGDNLFKKNLVQYQMRVGDLLSKIQISDKGLVINQKQQQNNKVNQQDSLNQDLLQEMYKIIQKKQNKIQQLTRTIKQATNNKNIIEQQYKNFKIQNKNQISNLVIQIQTKTQQLVDLQKLLEQERQGFNLKQRQVKNQVQKDLSFNNVKRQENNLNQSQNNNRNLNMKIQNQTQQTISSVRNFCKEELSAPRISLQKINSLKSFRRIGIAQEKQVNLNLKKAKILKDSNEELYKLLFCQASTIQQLL